MSSTIDENTLMRVTRSASKRMGRGGAARTPAKTFESMTPVAEKKRSALSEVTNTENETANRSDENTTKVEESPLDDLVRLENKVQGILFQDTPKAAEVRDQEEEDEDEDEDDIVGETKNDSVNDDDETEDAVYEGEDAIVDLQLDDFINRFEECAVVSSSSEEPLRGIPEHSGLHMRFSESHDGDIIAIPVEKPTRTALRGVAKPTGEHVRF